MREIQIWMTKDKGRVSCKFDPKMTHHSNLKDLKVHFVTTVTTEMMMMKMMMMIM